MKDLLIKRNKLRKNAMILRSVKFDEKVNGDKVTVLNKEQDKLWKKYKFYDNFIKANQKERELIWNYLEVEK